MAVRTITLTGAEVAVTGLDGANVHLYNTIFAAQICSKLQFTLNDNLRGR